MKTFLKLFIILNLAFFFSNCSDSTWKDVVEIYCLQFANCLNGTGIYDSDKYGICGCDCDDDWCGERCELSRSFCEGNGGTISFVLDRWNDSYFCLCTCPSPFTNAPHCNTIEIPFRPKYDESSFNGNGDYYKNLNSADYFPLTTSNTWIFDVLDSLGNKESEFGFMVKNNFLYEDIRYYNCKFLIPDTITGLVADSNVIQGPLLYNLPSDPNQMAQRVDDTTTNFYFFHHYNNGDTIIIEGDIAYVDSVGTINVPAGEYDDCFALHDTFGGGFIFAPGVGWIAFLGEGGDTTAVLSRVEITCSIGAAISIVNASCSGNDDGEINIDIEGDAAGYTFIWDGPTEISDEQNPKNLSPGLYYLTISNENCEAIVDSIPIATPNPINIELESIAQVACFGDSTGAIVVSVSGGTGSLEINWNEGAFDSEDISGLPAGCYSLMVIDSVGCTNEITVDILEPDEISLNAVITNVSCFDAQDGKIIMEVEGGNSGYQYLWDDGSTANTIDNLAPGDFGVTVTDQNNCSTVSIISVNQPDEIIVDISSLQEVSCFEGTDGSLQIEIIGGNPTYSILWESGESTETISSLSAGSYRVTVTDLNGCLATNEILLSEPEALEVSVNTFGNVTCYGGDDGYISLDIIGGNPGYSIKWENGETSETISTLSAGLYRVSVTDINGCEAVTEQQINQTDELLMNVSSFQDVSCYDGTDGFIEIDIVGGTPGYSILWETGETTENISSLAAGTYRATVTDSNGCEVINEVFIDQPDVLELSVSSFQDVSCYDGTDGSIALDIAGGTPEYSILWESGEDTKIISSLSAGSYRATVSDNLGCTAVYERQINQPEALNLNSENIENVSCFGLADGSVTTTVSGGTPGYLFNWNNNSYNTQNLNNLSGGTYNLIVTDDNGCTIKLDVEVTEPQDILLEFESTEATDGNANGTATVFVSGGAPGFTYLWDDANAQSTATIVGLTPNEYYVTVTDQNGCTKTGAVEVELKTATQELDIGSIQLFPNPVREMLILESIDEPIKIDFYEIFDIRGKSILRSEHGMTISSNIYIKADDLAKGVYVLRLSTKTESKSLLFVKI